ncbi:MAG: YdiU family protein, partial [Bacteroidetes bacterium]|nr:YdiU family protein [Bacteroidota bacterium]
MNLDKITQKYLEIFPTDFSENPMQRKISDYLICKIYPAKFHQYQLIYFNEKLSEEIGLGKFQKDDLDFLVGQNLPHTIQPFATAYAGHQFGNWAGQLGDGRAIYAGEINLNKKSTEIQWKGAGATPFSRAGDGRAALRSSVREFLMSEAIHHLGIPTTRALSICTTGEMVERDILYNGNPKE